MSDYKPKKSRFFLTPIEVLVIVLIVAVLAAILIPVFLGAAEANQPR